MAGRSAAKRTTPRRASGGQRDGRGSGIDGNKTTVTSEGSGGDQPSGGKVVPGGKGAEAKKGGATDDTGFKGRWDEFRKFLNQVKVEWGRVTWPGAVELAQATKVVLWTLLVFMTYLGVLDWILIQIFHWGPLYRR